MSSMKQVAKPLKYAFFLVIGLIMLHWNHVNWFSTGKQIEFESLGSSSLNMSEVITLLTGVAIIVFVSVFCIVLMSVKFKERSFSIILADSLFPTILFFIFLPVGLFSIYMVPLAQDWSNIMCLVFLGGVTAVSLHLELYFYTLRKSVNHELKIRRDMEIYSKRLELEHTFLQNVFQWLIWAIILFITGVVVGGFTNPVEPHPIEMRRVELQNTILFGAWVFTGIWFGIIAPMSRHMSFLRKSLEHLSVKKEKNDKTN